MSSDPQNPYSSPVAVAPNIDAGKHPHSGGDVLPASQGKRFLNVIVDNVALYGIGYVAGRVAGFAFMTLKNGRVTEGELVAFNLAMILVGWIIAATYYTGFELATGRTLGKFLTGTKVVAMNGSPPSAGQILGRSLCRFIPFEAFSFFGGAGRPVGWHDSISGTRVVEVR